MNFSPTAANYASTRLSTTHRYLKACGFGTYLGGDRTGDLYGAGTSRGRLTLRSRSLSRGREPLGDWLREYDRDLQNTKATSVIRESCRVVHAFFVEENSSCIDWYTCYHSPNHVHQVLINSFSQGCVKFMFDRQRTEVVIVSAMNIGGKNIHISNMAGACMQTSRSTLYKPTWFDTFFIICQYTKFYHQCGNVSLFWNLLPEVRYNVVCLPIFRTSHYWPNSWLD